jgi:DNA-binding MarR family transcriptional regulator
LVGAGLPRSPAFAGRIGHELGLDAGYLSRILRSFKKRGLIEKQPSETDGRQRLLWLTEQGQEAFATLNARSHREIEAMHTLFIQNYDPKRERCWIAEKDGENVGSVLLVKQSDTVAKLRLLLVEPKARGLGIGTRLVNECIRFARQAGYSKITSWTQSVLLTTRQIYQKPVFNWCTRDRRGVPSTRHPIRSRRGALRTSPVPGVGPGS